MLENGELFFCLSRTYHANTSQRVDNAKKREASFDRMKEFNEDENFSNFSKVPHIIAIKFLFQEKM